MSKTSSLSSLWWLTDLNILFFLLFFVWGLAPQPVGSKPVRLCCSMCVCVIVAMAKAEDCCSEWQAGALAFRSCQRFDISALQADGSRDRPLLHPYTVSTGSSTYTSHSNVASVLPTAAVWTYSLCFDCENTKHMQSCFHYTTSRWHDSFQHRKDMKGLRTRPRSKHWDMLFTQREVHMAFGWKL